MATMRVEEDSPEMIRERILHNQEEEERLREERGRLMRHLKSICRHEEVVECNTSPIVRICTYCGHEERGYGGSFYCLAQSKVIHQFGQYEGAKLYEFRKLQPLVHFSRPRIFLERE
jgi:hypothetical protein